MTRQYKWQIKMVREGKCKICGVPAVTKLYCEKHRLAANARTCEAAHKRRYPAAEYVSGLLRGPARRRFMMLLPAHPADS